MFSRNFIFFSIFLVLTVQGWKHCGWRTSPDIDRCCLAHYQLMDDAETSRERVREAGKFCTCLKQTIVANAAFWIRIRTNLLCDVRSLSKRTEGDQPTPLLKQFRELFEYKEGDVLSPDIITTY